MFDGEQKQCIRTYNDNVNNRQGFKIGWDVDQSRKEDTKIAGKVGQDQRNSYIPSYQTQTYQPEQKQDDEYLKQLYYQELSKKQELAAQYKQPESYKQPEPYNAYQDSLDKYNEKLYAQHQPQEPYQEYQQPQLLQQSNKYDNYQEEEQLYQKVQLQLIQYQQKQGNSGSKQNGYIGNGKAPVQQYNPITGIAYGNNVPSTYEVGPYPPVKTNPYEDKQQDDTLSQFSQLQQHRITSIKNKNSNIFNTDLQETENINTRQNSRILNRKKEMNDQQYKGYGIVLQYLGQFYKNPIEDVPTQYKEQKFVNRNKIDNHIFPK